MNGDFPNNTHTNMNNVPSMTKKTTLETANDAKLATVRMLAFDILRWEEQFNEFAAMEGKTPQRMREEIDSVVEGATAAGIPVSCLCLSLMSAYVEESKKVKWGFSDAELDREIKAARKRMKRLRAQEA